MGSRRLALGVSWLLFSAPFLAESGEGPPSTRSEALHRQRMARERPADSHREGALERQLLAIEKCERPRFFDLNLKVLYPTVASISAGSRLAPGVRYWQPRVGGSSVSLHASAAHSLAGYRLFDLQVGLIPHRPQRRPQRSTQGDDVYELGSLRPARLVLYASVRYRHNPDEPFYGLGPGSREEDRTSFLLQDAAYDLVAGLQLTPRIMATLRGGYLQVRSGAGTGSPAIGERFDDDTAPGLAAQPDFFRLSPAVLLDSRDEPLNPHGGGMVAASYTAFSDRGGGFAFTRFALDARGYLSLASPQRVLALRLYTSLDSPARGARVPFYLQEPLGTSHVLRGSETFRFRGPQLLSLQAEYRWEAIPAIELALFGDAGQVFDRLSAWQLRGWRRAYGFGLRLKSPEATLVRLDLARGEEGSRLYLRFGAAF